METDPIPDADVPEVHEAEEVTVEPRPGPILTLQERVDRLERLHVQFHGALPE